MRDNSLTSPDIYKVKTLVEFIEEIRWITAGKANKGGNPSQPHLGTRDHCYRCFLPDLAEFTVYRREGTRTGHHK